MKKLLLIIALLISALGLNAQDATIGGLRFTVTSETPAECEVSGYSGKPVDVTIPSTVTISGKEYSVTSIGDDAFLACSSLTSIEIPSGVTSIGGYAFAGCSSLTNIDFGENSQLTSIGDYAFANCSSLTSIEIPSGVTSIGYGAFYGCESLTSIEIPSGVTSIGDYAFEGCSSLTSVTFGENSQLTSIGEWAFYECSSLTSIDFGENSQLTSIGNWAFRYCSSLTSIEIPSGVTSIGGQAFSGCSSLTSVTFGENSKLTSIGYEAFYGCSSLTSIEIPSGVTSIAVLCAFANCSSLTSIVVESGNTVYDSRDNCNAIIETATNTLIAGCQNTVIPSSVTSIGDYAFANCSSLTSIDFGENSQLTSIGVSAFYECSSLTSIEIPSGVTSIGVWAFRGCSSLTSITFGENSKLTYIGESAFEDCSSLTSIEIPSGVTYIGERAFYNCSSLTSIDFGENSQLTSIRDYAFCGCSSLTSIEIPSGVTSIRGDAFLNCSSLTSIEIPSGVTSIGYDAFRSCSSLTSIEIPSSVTYIGERAFWYCSSLTSIVVESGNTVYDSRDNCNAIIETATNTLIAGCKNTVIPNSVTSIGDYAFMGCSSLTSIEIPSGVTSIGEYAFSWCSSLTSIEIPSGVTSIGYCAFYYCDNLTSIYCYAESVPETDSNAFNYCPSDMVIYVPEQSVDAYKAASPWNNYTIMVMPYFVTVATNPEDAGIITGAGAYAINDTVTLTAIANEGYKFINWTENDSVVSEVAEYTFVVESDRNLVANFEEIEQPTDSLVLSSPALAVNTVTETTVVLVWNPIDSATSYNVYMDSVLVKNVTDTVCTVDSLTAETTYSFMVTALADTLESEFSNAVTVTTLKAEGEEPEQPENPEEPIELDTPENVEATATSTSSIIITWDKVENALSYNIYRDGELLDDTENTSYTDKDLEYNTEYCYTIEAVNGKETSDESEEVCVKTLGEGVEELASSFNIYPNPVSDKLYIETQTQTQTVEIYDVYGRLQVAEMPSCQGGFVIEVSNLTPGVYSVIIKTDDEAVVRRFVKK